MKCCLRSTISRAERVCALAAVVLVAGGAAPQRPGDDAAIRAAIVDAVHALPDRSTLIEVVMDLGRRPEARFPNSEVTLLEREIDDSDIDFVVDHIGEFGEDNRAGIERTLHRISAIRNRAGKVVGLTCRIGRAKTSA